MLRRTRVLAQLRHRFAVEVLGAQRSALRRVLERDGSTGRYQVLCVSALDVEADDGADADGDDEADGGAGAGGNGGGNGGPALARIEVSDGWYACEALLDAGLTAQLRAGRVRVGMKLRVCGAVLRG